MNNIGKGVKKVFKGTEEIVVEVVDAIDVGNVIVKATNKKGHTIRQNIVEQEVGYLRNQKYTIEALKQARAIYEKSYKDAQQNDGKIYTYPEIITAINQVIDERQRAPQALYVNWVVKNTDAMAGIVNGNQIPLYPQLQQNAQNSQMPMQQRINNIRTQTNQQQRCNLPAQQVAVNNNNGHHNLLDATLVEKQAAILAECKKAHEAKKAAEAARKEQAQKAQQYTLPQYVPAPKPQYGESELRLAKEKSDNMYIKYGLNPAKFTSLVNHFLGTQRRNDDIAEKIRQIDALKNKIEKLQIEQHMTMGGEDQRKLRNMQQEYKDLYNQHNEHHTVVEKALIQVYGKRHAQNILCVAQEVEYEFGKHAHVNAPVLPRDSEPLKKAIAEAQKYNPRMKDYFRPSILQPRLGQVQQVNDNLFPNIHQKGGKGQFSDIIQDLIYPSLDEQQGYNTQARNNASRANNGMGGR